MEDSPSIELSQRGRGRVRERESPEYEEKVFVEKRLKSGDTLNKIALQYSVHVSELRRANNLLKDQDFLALTTVKIPMSKLRRNLRLGLEELPTEEDEDTLIHIDDQHHQELTHTRSTSAEDIFRKADATIAQVRESLPENTGEGGSAPFHFIDARPPDSGCSVLRVLFAVLFVFVIVPLLLTFYEESEESAEHDHAVPHYAAD